MVQSQVVLVGGGTGFVGRRLVALLKKGGAKVRIVTRKPSSNSYEQLSWDAIRRSGLPNGTTAVINLAGRNILEPGLWTDAYKREVYTSRIDSNKLLANAINEASNKPKSFVTVSGVGYYPNDSSTTEFSEEWQQSEEGKQSDNFLTHLARDWELASKLNEETEMRVRRVIIRAGVVVGPRGGIIQELMIPFKLGLGGPIGNGHQWFPWIHIDDLTSMFKFCIMNDHVEGVVNGVAPEQVNNKQFAQQFAKSLSRPAFMPLPSFAVKLIFGSERAPILLQGQKVKSRAALLGFRYQYPTLQSALVDCSTN